MLYMYGQCMGNVWAMYGHCMGNVWAMYGHLKLFQALLQKNTISRTHHFEG